MACSACTISAQCVACRMEGRPAPRLRHYEGRRGETLYKRDQAALDYFADAEDSPEWRKPEEDTPPARRTATQTQDHDFRARR